MGHILRLYSGRSNKVNKYDNSSFFTKNKISKARTILESESVSAMSVQQEPVIFSRNFIVSFQR